MSTSDEEGQHLPEFATNDPSNGQTVASAIEQLLDFTEPFEVKGRSVAIASAYFNVGGWSLIADPLGRVGRVRILLGAEPQRDTDVVVLRPPTLSAKGARDAELLAGLSELESGLAVERDVLPFTSQARAQVAALIEWLRSGQVEVKQYRKEFLHGKAFFVDEPAPMGVLAGSSNFTQAGLSRNRELNLGAYQPGTVKSVKHWFNALWDEAEPFDLAAFYEQQVLPADPWLVFLRMLWEAYGRQVAVDEDEQATDPSLRDLLPFQKDGVGRARRIIEKYNGVLIADEVGLGKSYLGGALVKDTVRSRQRVLIVAPKIIRDTVWRPYIDKAHLSGWVDVISYDDLIADVTPDGRRWRLDVARNPDEYSLVLLDEAHTVRNSDTSRAKALMEILAGNPRKQVVLLTATPVNNALADLHSLLTYFIFHDDEFAEIGVPSLATHFRELDQLDSDQLSPEALFDILDAVAVRRTRRFVRNHYKGQRFDDTGVPLTFPDPVLRRVDYDLEPFLGEAGHPDGFFRQFAHALGADRDAGDIDPFFSGAIPDEGLATLDPQRLSLAGYTPSRYILRGEEDIDRRQRAAEVQVAGLLRSGLLKRLESSSQAFVLTSRKMANTLEGLLDLIESHGLVASGESLRDWIRLDLDDDDAYATWQDYADYEPADQFNTVALAADIRNDMRLLRGFADTVETAIRGQVDPKFTALREMLAQALAEADRDARKRKVKGIVTTEEDEARRERDDRKVLVFSYYADTIHYLHENIDEILADDRLAPYRGRVAFVSGRGRKSSGSFDRRWMIDQDEAVRGFAPRTGGQLDEDGKPLSEDRFDLLFATDVLSQGVNLQQARNISSFDLPWNPQILVQRHGRVDRIGSEHPLIYLWTFFPDTGLDDWLQLEAILHRKLAKAAASVGHGHVLPGVAASEERVFNAKNEQIRAIREGDATILLEQERSLISGEEFRAILKSAIENASLERQLDTMPWSVGSGFTTDDRRPGFVFCARILGREDEPVFRYLPLPVSLTPGTTAALEPETNPDALATLEGVPTVRGIPVEVITDSLTALTMANPPDRHTPAHLPDEWQDLAYDAWATAQTDIVKMWNRSLDTSGAHIPAPIRAAIQHLYDHATHRNQADVDAAVKAFRRGQSSRVTSLVRAILRDDQMTDRIKADRLIDLVRDIGLTAPEARDKRYAITAQDVHLIAWMAIIPINAP